MQAGRHTTAVTLAVAALLSACGGGDTAPSAAEALGAPAPALAATASDAERLFAFLEQRFPQYFRGTSTTQALPPFHVRHYSLTGIMVGVVTTSGTPFAENGVYVIGGEFGNRVRHAGQITDFITVTAPVAPPPAPSGGTSTPAPAAGNGCFDHVLMDTPGTRISVRYNLSAGGSGTQTAETVVGGVTTFEGQPAREVTVTTTGTVSTGGASTSLNITARNYTARRSAVELVQYGGTATIRASGVTSTVRSVYSPAVVDRQAALAAGESHSYQQTVVATVTLSGLGLNQSQTQTTTAHTTVLFAGMESLRIAAGTFTACRFELLTDGQATTQWVLAGKGIALKTITPQLTLEAASITINGARP